MPSFKVYYKKPEEDGRNWFKCDPATTKADILNPDKYAFIREFTARDIEQVFYEMQGEIWSPNGEARDLIFKSGTQHTSMSVGDAAIDENGNVYVCDSLGWLEVKS